MEDNCASYCSFAVARHHKEKQFKGGRVHSGLCSRHPVREDTATGTGSSWSQRICSQEAKSEREMGPD